MKQIKFTLLLCVFMTIVSLSGQQYFNSGVYFTGGYVEVPTEQDFDLPTNMTVEVWMQATVWDEDWQAIVTKGDNSWRLQRSGSSSNIVWTAGGTSITTSGITFTGGVWKHIAGVKSGSTIKLYVDGELYGTATGAGNNTNNSYKVLIGENAQSMGRNFLGSMDEVRIWNYARTGEQIKANRYNHLLPSESGLVAYYKMDTYNGTTIYDETDLHDATLRNFTTPYLSTSWVAYESYSGDNAYVFGEDEDQLTYAPLWSSTSQFTAEAWFKPTEFLADERKVLYHGDNGEFAIVTEGNSIKGKVKITGAAWITLTYTGMGINQWYHAALVVDMTSNCKLYINGSLEGTYSFGAGLTLWDPGPNYTGSIGSQNGTSQFFRGYIDEVRIWNICRTEPQIWDNRHANLDNASPGLKAYYKFNEGGVYDRMVVYNQIPTNNTPGTINCAINGYPSRTASDWPVGQYYIGGTVSSNTTWPALTMGVWGNVVINSGAKLTLQPGTTLNFLNHYGILANGSLQAVGTVIDSIKFTVIDTTGFAVQPGGVINTLGSWNGIVIQTSSESDSTIIERCIIENAKAGDSYLSSTEEQYRGGAIFVNDTNKYRISDSRISHNIAAQRGGAIAFRNTTGGLVKNCKIYDNKVTNADGDQENKSGGAIHAYNSVFTVQGCNISNNQATGNGGAIFTQGNTYEPVYKANIISGNQAGNKGGGVCLYDFGNATQLLGNHIDNNTALEGGGLALYNYGLYQYPYIYNNVITNNNATNGGGILAQKIATPYHRIANNTIADNTASGMGGGIYFYDGSTLHIRNSIIWGNTAAAGAQIYLSDNGCNPYIRYCNIQGGMEAFAGIGAGANYPSANYVSCINANPKFDSTPELPYKLHYASSCINRGETGVFITNYDYAGNPRVYQTGISTNAQIDAIMNSIDIGAYEDQSASGVLPYDYSIPNGNINHNLTIPSGVTLTMQDSYSRFPAGKGIDVYGSLKTPANSNPSGCRVYLYSQMGQLSWKGLSFFDSGSAADSSYIEYTQITQANKTGESQSWGGGIYVNGYDKLVVSNCVIFDCEAEKGGGIAAVSSSAKFYSNSIHDCQAQSGGGAVYLDNSSLYLIHNTITENSSITGCGGVEAVDSPNSRLRGSVVWNNGESPISGTLNVLYCVVEGGYTGSTNVNADPFIITNDLYKARLQPHSVCLNKGISDTTVYPHFPLFDIVGNPRIHEHTNELYNRLDVGAYEYAGLMTPSEVQASDGENQYPGYVLLSWNFWPTYQPFTSFLLYRDGALLQTVVSQVYTYADYTAIPGQRHVYGVIVVAGSEATELITDVGYLKPNGIITGTVKTPNNNPVAGVSVTLEPSTGFCMQIIEGSFFGVEAPDADFGASFTLETWVKTSMNDVNILIKADDDLVQIQSLKIDADGKLAFTDGISTITQNQGTMNISNNQWHHVAMVYDASLGNGYLYLDGACVADTTIAFQEIPADLEFLASDYTMEFRGYLDDIRLWNIARSAQQIQDCKDFIMQYDAPGLIGYWPLNEGSGEEGFDATDYCNHAIFHGVWSAAEPGIGLGGTTNNWGEYVIAQIPYGQYTTFAVTPAKENHFFQPQQRLITLSTGTISANDVDFTDNSMISISGSVFFSGTVVPVREATILLNGVSIIPPQTTDDMGHYAIDVEHGTECELSVSYHDQEFDRTWNLGAVTYPQANKNFYNLTTTDFLLEALGGDDGYCIGSFDVRILSKDMLYEREWGAELFAWETGRVMINNIPPLEYDVFITPRPNVNPEDPDVYPGDPFSLLTNDQFMSNNSAYLDIRYPDAELDTLTFIYRQPLSIEVTWPDDYQITYLAEDEDEEYGFYVTEQNQWISLRIMAFEDYSFEEGQNRKTAVKTANIRINDEVGTKGITETSFAGNTYVTYNFAPYLPNITYSEGRGYQNMMEVTVYDPVLSRYATQTDWVIIKGVKPTETTYASTSPEIPFMVLHDPPGDKSYSSFKETSSHSTNFSVSVSRISNNNQHVSVHMGPKITYAAGTAFFSVEVETEFTADFNYGITYNTIQKADTLIINKFTTSQEYKTSEGNSLIGRESDLYLGGAMNLLWGITKRLNWDPINRTIEITNDVMVTPEGFATTYIYTESQILLSVIPNLYAIGDSTSAAVWESFVAMNSENIANAVPNPNHVSNVSFNAGAGYLYEETNSSSTTRTFYTETTVSQEFGAELGFTVNGVGTVGGFKFETGWTIGRSSDDEDEIETTVSFMLADDDETSNLNYQSDYFTVDVKTDPVYGTPVFDLLGGASSNRWEQNTMCRDAVTLRANTYTATGLQETEVASFLIFLGNESQTEEDRRYYLTLHHETNPWGAQVLINGLPLVERMPFDVPPSTEVQVVMTVTRGPFTQVYDYSGITLEFYAEGDRGNQAPDGYNFYVYKSFDVIWETPYSKVEFLYPNPNWTINQFNNNQLDVVLRGYDLNKPNLESLKLQYKRPYQVDWIEAAEIPRADLIGTIYKIINWDVSALSDGPYEIRAGTVNTGMPDYYTVPLAGYMDRISPQLLNLPQPSDGILGFGDLISMAFTEFLDPTTIVHPDSTYLEVIRTGEKIATNVTRFENTVYLNPDIANYWIENETLRAKVGHLYDLYGNPIEVTESWEFFVNANPVAWTQTKLELLKPLGQSQTVTAYLHNSGGQTSSFSITDLPEWITVNCHSGTLLPLDNQTLVFTISEQLGYGTHRDTIFADIPALGREPLVFEVSVLANPPSWATNQLDNFDYSMTITGQLFVDGTLSTDTNDIIGAFVLDNDLGYLCRGMASLQRVPFLENSFQFFLSVHSNEEEGEELIFRVWDSSTNKEHFGIEEQFTFEAGAIYGTAISPVLVHVLPQLISTVPCKSGWNWISVNLLNQNSMSVDTLLTSLSPTSNDYIKNQTSYAQYSPGVGWVGSLQEISTTEMVKLKLATADDLHLIGTLENPNTTPIQYGGGWNWIGYLPHVSISVNQAMTNLENASTGDMLKSQTGYSQYIEGYGWFGSLLFMKPGAGYMLHTQGSGTLYYPEYQIPRDEQIDSYAERLRSIRNPEGWNINPLCYEYTSSITSIIKQNGITLNEPNLMLGAFYDNECRGIAIPVWVQGQWMFFLTQYSNVVNQTFTYKLYNTDNGTIHDLNETLPFINNQILGHPLNPYVFNYTLAGLGQPQNLTIQIAEGLTTLSWDAVSGANSYLIYASERSDGEFVDVTNSGSFRRTGDAVPDSLSNNSEATENRNRISWFYELPEASHKFYYVKASTNIP